MYILSGTGYHHLGLGYLLRKDLGPETRERTYDWVIPWKELGMRYLGMKYPTWDWDIPLPRTGVSLERTWDQRPGKTRERTWYWVPSRKDLGKNLGLWYLQKELGTRHWGPPKGHGTNGWKWLDMGILPPPPPAFEQKDTCQNIASRSTT